MGSGPGALRAGWLVVVSAFLLNTLYGIFNAFGVFFPPLIEEFGWSRTITSSVFSAYAVSYSASSILFGRWADRKNIGHIALIGGWTLSLGIFLSRFAQSEWQLILAFGVAGGVGGGGLYVPMLKAVNRKFSPERGLSLAVGVVVAGTGVGSLFFPYLSSLLISVFDWRDAFALLGISGLILTSISIAVARGVSGGFVKEREPQPSTEVSGMGRLQASLLNRRFWILYGTDSLAYAGQTAVIVHLAPFAVDRGVSLTDAGVILGLAGFGTIFGRVLFGRLLERFHGGTVLVGCLLVQAAIVLAFTQLSNFWSISLFASLWGVTWGVRIVQVALLIRETVGTEHYGRVFGIMTTSFGVGGLLGPLVSGYTYDVYGSYEVSFFLNSALPFSGGLLAIGLRRRGEGR